MSKDNLVPKAVADIQQAEVNLQKVLHAAVTESLKPATTILESKEYRFSDDKRQRLMLDILVRSYEIAIESLKKYRREKMAPKVPPRIPIE